LSAYEAEGPVFESPRAHHFPLKSACFGKWWCASKGPAVLPAILVLLYGAQEGEDRLKILILERS